MSASSTNAAVGAVTPLPESGQFGRVRILLAERRLMVDDQHAPLGSRAFDLLAALAQRRDRVVSKDELLDVVWPGLVVEENNLQVQISALRKVLGSQAIATLPGRGYQFTVAAGSGEAPASSADIHAAPATPTQPAYMPPPARMSTTRAARLLVADDNKVNRLLLCRSLELMGHEVASVADGRAALAELLRGGCDLLLLDLEMPELDGFSLLERRAADPALRNIPVIVTSSLEGAAQVARCIELGADDYLHKPVNPTLLKARVDSSLERKRLRDRQRELVERLAPGLPEGVDAASHATLAQRADVTLLAMRLRDFNALASTQSPQETMELLNNWSTLVLDAIEQRGGLVQQIGGDGIAAVFGAPPSAPVNGADDAAWACAQAAIETFELAALFNAERAAAGKAAIELSAGISTGSVVAGYAGTPRRAAYVCIGDAVQRAAQLSALAAERGSQVLIDEATHAALKGRIASLASAPGVYALKLD